MKIYLIFCFCMIFVISLNENLDVTTFINSYGPTVCPYTNFCHTKATETLNNDTHMPCCLPCSCEENCWRIGNCCPDRNVTDFEFPELKCIDTMVKRRANDNSLYAGYTVGIQRYRVKDSCLGSENNETLIKLCTEDDKTTIEKYTWVSEKSSGRIFQNRYCALCNNVTDFVEWQIRTRYWPTLFSNISQLLKSIFSDHSVLTTEVPVIQLKLAEMYRCLIPQVSKCNESGLWRHFDETIVRACEMYESPIFIPDHIRIYTYKNIYCYICNVEFVRIDNTVCANWEIESKDIGHDFSALIDFRRFQQDHEETNNAVCHVEEVYDMFMKQCRNLLCPYGSTAYYGKCENVALETRGLKMLVRYNIQILQNQSRICPNDFKQLDKEALVKSIKRKFMKLLGVPERVCPMCGFELRIVKTQQQGVATEFVLSTVFSTDLDCQLDLLFHVTTSVFGKEMKIVLSDCLSFKMIYRLEKRSQQFIFQHPPINKGTRDCSAMFLLDKEEICPEVKIRPWDLISWLGKKTQADVHALFRTEDDIDNNTITVCWKDYISVMSQIYPTSSSPFTLSPDQIRKTILSLAVYHTVKFMEFLYVM